MFFLVTVKKIKSISKIREIQMLQVEPSESQIVHSEGEGTYLFSSNSDTIVNKLINDYEHVGVSIVKSGSVEELRLTFDDASEDPHTRAIPTSAWEPRTRPALMRAATTTHLFNA